MTRLDEVDADFAYQGEYAGVTPVDDIQWRSVGLQVVALGKGKFDAVEYPGGLPGAGWIRPAKHKYHGTRAMNAVKLVGKRRSFLLRDQKAYALTSSGRVLSVLRKVNRRGPTLGQPPLPGALVLFKGEASSMLDKSPITKQGWLQPEFRTNDPYSDFHLHVEFRTPYKPLARGQARGNSGVYIQLRYEVQILDSFGLEGKANECGGLYRQRPPDVNMCLPPLSWQTYDIYFVAARWSADGKKTAPAQITVLHNGVAIHENVNLKDKTGAGRREGPQPLPIRFQGHGNPVAFRNLWLKKYQWVEVSPSRQGGGVASRALAFGNGLNEGRR